jgi:hypothetical protein
MEVSSRLIQNLIIYSVELLHGIQGFLERWRALFLAYRGILLPISP